jgi:LPXTG-site transpeptidase (sortase) family protein
MLFRPGQNDVDDRQKMRNSNARQGLLSCFVGMALLAWGAPLLAQQDQDTWVPVKSVPAQPAGNPVWIQDPYTGDTELTYVAEPDYSLWNGKRIDDYHESMKEQTAPPLGILTIPSVNIQVAVWNGTEEVNLNRGAGRVRGMARMGGDGNLALSSHRDGFFRGLKDVQVGDDIDIQTPQGEERFAVSSITIVDKKDISPLAPTEDKTLTLITCYPFYFVGNAPKRYIVTAKPRQSL